MKFYSLIAALTLSSAVLATGLGAQTPAASFRKAVSMYEAGMYAEAGDLFRTFSRQYGDPLAEGWGVLCATKLKTPGYEDQIEAYSVAHPSSAVLPEILFTRAENLFDAEDYAAAEAAFFEIDPSDLKRPDRDRFLFKNAYSSYATGHYDSARDILAELSGRENEYRHPSEYALAYIHYDEHRFGEAFKYFSAASEDPRFETLSKYYMTECKFMQKDYGYVVTEGVRNFDSVPRELRTHAARIISESFLISGDAASAARYYEENVSGSEAGKDTDWFYAGSVEYAVGHWREAIDNYSRMADRSDSLWQIAAYQTGYSNIKLRNKVEALDAFKSAASLSFDPEIREDAFYNWAKLSFDINNDPAPFNAYMKAYPVKENNEKIYSYIALAALLNHDYAAAIDAYDNIDELDSKDRRNYVKANYLRAEQLVSALAWRGAVPCLEAAIYFSGEDESVRQASRYWLGQSYYMDDNFSEAARVFKDLFNTSALEGSEEGVRIPYDLAYCYYKQQDWASAAKWFDRYLEGGKVPEAKDASVRRADCDFFRKDYKKAAAAYDAIFTADPDPDDVYVYYQDAVACGLLGQKARKISLLENVLKADKSSPLYNEAMYELGSAYVEKGASDDASKVFTTLKNTTSSSDFAAKSMLRLGMINGEKRNYARALEYYKKVVSDYMTTTYAESALGAIASIYTEMGQGDKYLDYAASLGKISSKSEAETEQMYFDSAEQVYLSANYGQAVSALENFKQRYPDGRLVGKADFYIAECYRNLGRKDLALDYYSKSIEGGEGDYVLQAMKNYADLAYGVERYSDAFGAYSALRDEVGSAPERLDAAAGMARSAYRARNYADAATAVDDALTLGAEGDLRRELSYIKAKSCMASSRRDDALAIFRALSKDPMTAEGAEACYLLIQDCYDRGNFSSLNDMVNDFTSSGTPHVYWVARALVTLGDSYAAEGNKTQARYVYEGISRNYEGDDDISGLVELRLRKLEQD